MTLLANKDGVGWGTARIVREVCNQVGPFARDSSTQKKSVLRIRHGRIFVVERSHESYGILFQSRKMGEFSRLKAYFIICSVTTPVKSNLKTATLKGASKKIRWTGMNDWRRNSSVIGIMPRKHFQHNTVVDSRYSVLSRDRPLQRIPRNRPVEEYVIVGVRYNGDVLGVRIKRINRMH